MPVLSTLLDILLRTLPGRLILWVISKMSGRVQRTINASIAADIEVGSVSSRFAGDEGQPTPYHITIRLRSRTPIDLQVESISLRIGFSSNSQTFRNISWSREDAAQPPGNLSLPNLEAKTDTNISIETILPEWMYFLQADRRPVFVTGSVQFSTNFGKVELPINESVMVHQEEVESLTETREFLYQNSSHREEDTESA